MADLSQVVVERVVRCPFSVAHDYAEDFFRDAAAGGAEVRVPLRDVFAARGLRLRRPVRMMFDRHPDETDAGRAHDALTVAWHAGTRLLPNFHGALSLRILSVDETLLQLDGSYRPPLGAVGRAFDAIVGRRIARATLHDLLERLANAMEARERAFRERSG